MYEREISEMSSRLHQLEQEPDKVHDYENFQESDLLFEIPVETENFVSKQLKALDDNIATGLDGLSARFFKIAYKVINTHLLKIFDLSISTVK